jgi:hypothetical protein
VLKIPKLPRFNFFTAIPAAPVQILLGPAALRNGLHNFLGMLQHERINKQLVYMLLDILVEAVAPAI